MQRSQPRILFIPLEFATWKKARHLSYGSQLALEEGLEAAGVDFLTVPAVCLHSCAEAPTGNMSPWLSRIAELCAGRTFDQVWLELAHSNYNDEFLDWVTGIAPVRVGFLGESLTYPQAILKDCPVLQTRENIILNRLRYMTHALFADEVDAARVSATIPGINTDFYFSPVPSRILSEESGRPKLLRGLFIGAVYGDRAKWLREPALEGLLEGRLPPEADSDYPALFDELNQRCGEIILPETTSGNLDLHETLGEHLKGLRMLRRGCYDLWNSALREAALVVNLPQFGSLYAGRVLEGMAVGRPVATMPLKGRPRTMAAFESGRDILHYDTPTDLAKLISRTVSDPGFSAEIVARAKEKIVQFATVEALVKKILTWTGVGENMEENNRTTPLKAPPPPTDHDTAFYTHHFTQHPEWSKAEPNQDEQARLGKILNFAEQALGPAESQPVPRKWRILDLGCGRGWLTNRMTAWGECTGVEPIAPVLENARHLFPGIQFYPGTSDTILSLPDFKPFDLVVSTEVIEHVPRDAQPHFVDNIRKLLKRRGYVIVTTPRAEAWDAWYQLARPDQPVEDWLSETDMQNLFSGCGFEALGIQRIYVGAPGISYFNYPAPEEILSGKIFPIYQVWLFQAP